MVGGGAGGGGGDQGLKMKLKQKPQLEYVYRQGEVPVLSAVSLKDCSGMTYC